MTSSQSSEALRRILEDVEGLLQRHRVLETFTRRQQTPRRDLLEQLQERQNLVELRRHLDGLHPADVAYLLSSLSAEDRVVVWKSLAPASAGPALVELEPEVRNALVESSERRGLVDALATLDADDLAYVSGDLPEGVLDEVSRMLSKQQQQWVRDSLTYPDDSVGRLMTREVLTTRDDRSVGQAAAELRGHAEVPHGTDRLYVIDARHLLRGTLPIHLLLTSDPETPIASVMRDDVAPFRTGDEARRAAKAFERYDLISAPVVDERGKLVGRLTVDAVIDFLRAESDQDALVRAGLRGAEDLFATVPDSVRNRWPWLCLNLVTAFAASRVIGVFESTIASFAALAALMPIVASLGGNTGNQTVALVIRAMALDELRGAAGRLVQKELIVAAVNGLVWGTAVGLVAAWLYSSFALGVVMTAAIVLNLVLAALAGLAVPLALRAAGQDPAHGASVVLTFITDSAGFFLFLGLARLFLV